MNDIPRREFLKRTSGAGLTLALNTALDQPLLAFAMDMLNTSEESGAVNPFTEEDVTRAAELSVKLEHESDFKSDIIDILGTLNFAKGVRQLLPGGKGYISSSEYYALVALILIRSEQFRSNGDVTGIHHIEAELKSALTSGTIIEGTVVLAEGLKFNLVEAYEDIVEQAPTDSDKIALITMLSSVLSPFVTTVGSARIMSEPVLNQAMTIKAEFQEKLKKTIGELNLPFDESSHLSEKGKDFISICISHISNLSGFILAGDPPFIAVIERFGFVEGVTWQLERCLPLAIESLFAANYKLNRMMLEQNGYKGDIRAEALRLSYEAIKNNISVLASIIMASVKNVASYLKLPIEESEAGIKLTIVSTVLKKLDGLIKLPFSDDLNVDPHHHSLDDHDITMVEYTPSQEVGAETLVLEEILEIYDSNPVRDVDRETFSRTISEFLQVNDYEGLRELLNSHEVVGTDYIIDALEEFQTRYAKEKFGNGTLKPYSRQWFADKINPIKIFNRMTSIRRMQNAFGHSFTDILNVFPFQAASVIFLVPVFKDLLDAMKNTIGDKVKIADKEYEADLIIEMMVYVLIMMFSGVADNYVATKIGFELLPEKPHLPLIAAINGGYLTMVANMADPALISLDKYTLMDSINRVFTNVDQAVIGFLWSNVIDLIEKVGILKKPEINITEEHHEG